MCAPDRLDDFRSSPYFMVPHFQTLHIILPAWNAFHPPIASPWLCLLNANSISRSQLQCPFLVEDFPGLIWVRSPSEVLPQLITPSLSGLLAQFTRIIHVFVQFPRKTKLCEGGTGVWLVKDTNGGIFAWHSMKEFYMTYTCHFMEQRRIKQRIQENKQIHHCHITSK